MLVYIFIYVCVLLMIFFSLFEKSKNDDTLFVIFSLILIFLASFRSGIGTDYENYIEIFNGVQDIGLVSNSSDVEWGYTLLNSLVRFTGLGFWLLAFICSLINFLCLYKILKYFSINRYLGLAIYTSVWYMGMNYNIIRHGMAVALTWVAFTYINNRKFYKFLLFIILAASIHKIAYAFIPFYWLLRVRLPFIFVLLIIPLCMILGYKFDFFTLSPILTLVSDNAKIRDYIEGETVRYGLSLGFVLNYILVLIYYYINNFTIKNQDKVFVNAMIVGLCTIGILNSIGVFVERLAGLLLFSSILILPNIFSAFIKKIYIIGIIFAIIIYCTLFFVTVLKSKEKSGEYQYLPYKSIFEPR